MQTRRDGQVAASIKDRRLPPERSTRARLRWLRGLVLRPFQLRWQRGPRLVWVERRSGVDPELTRLRADLHAEMLSVEDAPQVLRELVRVDELLGEAGWVGLASLPATTRARARLQAEMLAEGSGSAPLAGLVRRLQAVETAALLAADATAPAAKLMAVSHEDELAQPTAPEVSELGEEAYAQAEQLWASSQPAPLAPSPSAVPDAGLKA